MRLFKAKVADVIRGEQRDQLFIQNFQNDLFSIAKSLGTGYINKFMPLVVPLNSALWYYTFTSLSNLQTLGEEYTGTLRITDDGVPPNKLLQMMWLACYIGGEPLWKKLMTKLEFEIRQSETMKPEAKQRLLSIVSFFNNHKEFLIKMHHSWFYINGDYYHISSRFTGIKHVLLREWLQDSTSSLAFKILGGVSLIYLLLCLVTECFSSNVDLGKNCTTDELIADGRTCPLCAESRHDTCVTPCGHLFCWKCIYEALRHQKSCPVCREAINPSRIVFLQNYS